MRVPDEATRNTMIDNIKDEQGQFKLDCITEENYFAKIQSTSALGLKAIA